LREAHRGAPRVSTTSTTHARIVYPQQRSLPRRVRAFIDWVTPVLRRYFEGQDD
jgi:DNA-binding transcriptional LysR family regulator